MSNQRSGNLSMEIGSAYLAAAARVASWAAVSALVWRRFGADAFALLALIRGTLALLNYTAFGLGPAMIRLKAVWDAESRARTLAAAASMTVESGSEAPVLSYQTPGSRWFPSSPATPQSASLFFNGWLISIATLLAGLGIGFGYRFVLPYVHTIPHALLAEAGWLAVSLATGSAFRMSSESAGAVLQTHGHILADNILQAAADVAWIVAAVLMFRLPGASVAHAGGAFFWSGIFLLGTRYIAASRIVPLELQRPDPKVIGWLLKYGMLVTLGSVADFCYSPSSSILINRLRPASDLAAYSAAIQIDAALLLLVSGLAAVMLPRAAAAVGRHEWHTVRRYYVLGTLASACLLISAGLATWLMSPILLKAWLKNPPAATATILPLVLIHNAIGGCSHVGRAVILALGRARAFMMSLLIAGIANVTLGFVLLRFTDLGLSAIPLATILVVTGRAVLWTPWYVMKCLRNAERAGQASVIP